MSRKFRLKNRGYPPCTSGKKIAEIFENPEKKRIFDPQTALLEAKSDEKGSPFDPLKPGSSKKNGIT